MNKPAAIDPPWCPERILTLLVEGTSQVFGEEFFYIFVRCLAQATEMRFAFVAELEGPEKNLAQTIAFWTVDQYGENCQCELRPTPCFENIKRGIYVCPSGVAGLYPDDPWLQKHGIESYIGVTLRDSTGNCIGLAALMDEHPLRQVAQKMAVLKIFSGRAACELERMQTERVILQTRDNLALMLKEQAAELKAAHNKLLHNEKLAAIGRLSASIAHEFSNPLHGVANVLAGLEKRAILQPEDRELLVVAREECRRMRDLLRDLQHFSRPGAGKITEFALNAALDQLLLLANKELTKRRIKLLRDYQPNLPPLRAVADQIKQVALNLLSNAMDACEAGGLITITTARKGDHILLQVTDNGRGIKAEEMPRIFEPFFTTKEDKQGNGLGLAISYGIVKQHGGVIKVASRAGKGATFTVSLPIMGVP